MVGYAVYIVGPAHVFRPRVAAKPWAVGPPRILVAHAHGVGYAVVAARLQILRRVVPCRGLPRGVVGQLLTGVARHRHHACAVGARPHHQFTAERRRVATPACVGALQHGVAEARLREHLRQTTGEARLLGAVCADEHAREVAPHLGHAVHHLAYDALALYVVEVGLCVRGVGVLHLPSLRHAAELAVGFGRACLHCVPRLWLYLQSYVP